MTAKMHRVHIAGVGEGVIYLPGGCPYELYDSEEWLIGSYLKLGNKGYVFAHVGTAGITVLQYGAKQGGVRQPVGWSTIAATVAAGVKQITIDLAAGAGPAADGNILKDALKGGEVCIMPTWGTGFTRHILGNSAVATGAGGEFTVDFDSPTPAELTVDIAHAECIPSPYKDVAATGIGDGSNPVVGMPTCLAAAGKYTWLQVEGPFGIAAQTDVGNAEDRMQCVFRPDGTIAKHLDTDGHEAANQHAGVIMFLNLAGGQGTPFCNLQIAH